MLWLVTGGIAGGKSAFAAELARRLGKEGIRLYCPPFPERGVVSGDAAPKEPDGDFLWTSSDADGALARKIHRINTDSNFFRAERRVLVLDSLSGWLRGLYRRAEQDGHGQGETLDGLWRETLEALLSFEGKVIVVTEEPLAGLALDERTMEYAYRLAEANRLLAETAVAVYRLTFGTATEVKGYRVEREGRDP
ncbi:bifunctional adenosylcobinamide kinase/adenosylcobinamide-phosphate guanylyltransferase [Paenibacillaceae bacterium WGS1546]|uniref:bifunctional adenosylcobinamide kinase/adenosylcobinamide-phosphate guanylyltransferase n=1 Tax=Cohnella sp. WGS1546 TaxID=3366810 RepID=UPI00372D398F